MKDSVWKTVALAGGACMVACAIVCLLMGGCERLLVTTEGGTCHMSCYWCFRASAATGVLGGIAALVQAFMADARSRRGTTLLVAAAAITTVLFNTTPLIGICGDVSMVCHETALVVDMLCAACLVLCAVAFAKPVPAAEKPKMGL